MNPALAIDEQKNSKADLILVLDKTGELGNLMAEKLASSTQVVLCTGKNPELKQKNILTIPYQQEIPQIPDAEYSYIFFIWDGQKDSFELVGSCIKKALENKAKFIFLSDYSHLSKETIPLVFANYSQVVIVALGDIISDRPEQFGQNRIKTILAQALIKKIVLSNTGLLKNYPVLLEDALVEVFKIAFTNLKTQKLFLLFSKTHLTDLSFAHSLQQIDPLVEIDFASKKTVLANNDYFSQGEYVLAEDYSVLDKLKFIYNEMAKTSSTVLTSTILTKQQFLHNRQRSFFPPALASALLFLVLMLILPFVSCLFSYLLGLEMLIQAKNNLEKANLNNSYRYAQAAKSILSFSRQALLMSAYELSSVKQQGRVYAFLTAINSTQTAADGIVNLTCVGKNITNTLSGVSLSNNQLAQAIGCWKQGVFDLRKLSLEKNLPDNLSRQIKKLATVSSLSSNLIDALPQLLGMDKTRTYLILFQNNMELRPGGGFIGSYGLLTLDKGKIKNFSIHDVYDADGQLKGHIEPPYPIRRYIPLVHWYLRDSNFDVDFVKDAYQAAFFLSQETNVKADGVIGVDLSLVKNVIAALGNVYVPGYNENVNAENFFLLTEAHAEQQTFAGSTQKKDFLQALFTGIQEKFAVQKNFAVTDFLQNLVQSALEKHLVLAFSNSALQSIFTVNNLSSTLWDNRPVKNNTINDFLGISEANLGVNKANYFLTRDVKLHSTISDQGKITESVEIKYHNSSTNVWPGGDYKNYLRLILPLQAKITGVTIDGIKQTLVAAVTDFSVYERKNFLAPKGLEVNRYDESDKTIYGFLVTVPFNSDKDILVDYTLAQSIDLSQPLVNYKLWYFKQPGTDSYPFSFTLVSPANYKTQTSQGQFNYSTNLDTDQRLGVSLFKK